MTEDKAMAVLFAIAMASRERACELRTSNTPTSVRRAEIMDERADAIDWVMKRLEEQRCETAHV